MTDQHKTDPAKKMRKLLGSGKESSSPISRLPKKDASSTAFLPLQDADDKLEESSQVAEEMEKEVAPQTAPKPARSFKGLNLNLKLGPPFWTIASIISLTVNVVLLVVLLALVVGLQRSGIQVSALTSMGNNLLGGLYTNFEKMDAANIKTEVKVDTTIPVKFDLQLNQTTNVILSQDVRIDDAVVTVKTGGLNITNALTTIVLPQGTTLPVVLNLTVPVDTTVPVTLIVPVDIPLDQTELHEPFTGLQDVVKPFYCLINSSALNLKGEPVCK